MEKKHLGTVLIVLSLLGGFVFSGCGESGRDVDERIGLAAKIDLGTTIGSLVEVYTIDVVPVEGFAIVGGLNGTGSAECPPDLRVYLKKYIRKQLPRNAVNINKFINSPNTAVVWVRGIMPASVSGTDYFDVKVIALPGTQTTSLEGGWLYGVDLQATGSMGIASRILAEAEGPVFIDKLDGESVDPKQGYILAGGTVRDKYKIRLMIREPDFKVASLIHNRLNQRYGQDVAKALSASQIELKVTSIYGRQKRRFISLVQTTYMTAPAQATKDRINKFIRGLAVDENKLASEIALEAIGKESLGKLAALLNSSNEQVRLGAARCMLNLESDEGLGVLRQIALDRNSEYRLEALYAITAAAKRNDASVISRRLLRDEDFDIRLAAYEQLRRLDDISVTKTFVGRKSYLEEI